MRICSRYLLLWLLLCSFMPEATSSASLQPDQVVVLANRNSTDSVAVARHYAAQRGLTERQIIVLDVPLGETISRSDYEVRLVLPLRAALERNGWQAKARALVVTYDLPLRVAAPVLTPEQAQALGRCKDPCPGCPRIADRRRRPCPTSLHRGASCAWWSS
ncbi:MAG: hypothetical protein U0361_08295 [Nitrospiraceae bacterium]